MENDFVSQQNAVEVVTVDLRVYSLDSLLKTAYWYTDRCFLHLQSAGSDNVEIRFKTKPGKEIKNLAEQFMNDLLDQTLRERLAKDTEAFRNLIVAHALSQTCLINPELESAEPSEDPHKIAVSDDAKRPKI